MKIRIQSRAINMTEGPILRGVLLFALPPKMEGNHSAPCS